MNCARLAHSKPVSEGLFPVSLLHSCARQPFLQASTSRRPNSPVPSLCSRIQSNVEGLYLIDGVPFSCCNPHSPRPCLQSRLSDPHAHPLFDPRQPNLNLWAQGCHGVLLGHLQGLASTLGSMLAVTFLLQVSQQSV